MVKDISYIIKRILIGVGIALILMLFKGGLIADVHAQTTGYTLYDSNYNLLKSGTSTKEQNINVQNVSRIRINFDNSIIANGTYEIILQLQVARDSQYISFPSTPVICVNGTCQSGVTQTILNDDRQQTGSNTYFRDLTLKYQFNSSNNGTSNFWEGTLNTPGRITYLNVEMWRVTQTAVDNTGTIISVGDQIVNNQNENTNSIINNAHEDTNNITNHIDDLNDNLTDDSVDNPNSDINTMKGKLASNGTITQLISLPVTLYQSILNNINGSCHPFNLGALYNHNLIMPCINLQNILGSTIWNIIDLLCCFPFILAFRKKMVDIFNHMSSLKDRGNELE